MDFKKELNTKRKKYIKEWSITANDLYTNNHYEWMAEHVDNYKRVLEIGCGDGSSTLVLCNKGHIVVSIDENIECLKLAEKNLKNAGVKVKLIKREKIMILQENRYITNYSKIDVEIEDNQVLLIEGDILRDVNLITWIKTISPFDAVVCWLIGSHGFRKYNEVCIEKKIELPGHYRIIVQNTVYEISDSILKKDGILHIVDRAETPKTEKAKEDFLDSHRDQASVTSLKVSSLSHRKSLVFNHHK